WSPLQSPLHELDLTAGARQHELVVAKRRIRLKVGLGALAVRRGGRIPAAPAHGIDQLPDALFTPRSEELAEPEVALHGHCAPLDYAAMRCTLASATIGRCR